MPRSLRLEYEGAYYHVMNRGRGRRTIFHDRRYYLAFIESVVEAYEKFNAVIHAYCLMGNHYHLLIETPDGNIGRIMRHINGVYTQRHNRLKNTDGPLFRGRYQSILVDKDSYLLPLSRYIHRNPVDTKKPLVSKLEEYPWSSYSAYVGSSAAPAWLEQGEIYAVLGKRRKYQGYREYVETGVDKEISTFYNKGRLASILGNDIFQKTALEKNRVNLHLHEKKKMLSRPNAQKVIAATAKIFAVSDTVVVTPQKGRQQRNLARKVAMYFCQQNAGMTLQAIAKTFGISHKGGVSNALTEIRRLLVEDKALKKQLQKIKKIIQ